MTPAKTKAFEFKPLTEYPLKDRLFIKAAGLAVYCLMYLISKTLRYELKHDQTLDEIIAGLDSPVLCSYHDRLLAGAPYLRDRRFVALVSSSKDGEFAARTGQRFGFGMVRGSSSRGGQEALLELAALMKTGSIVFLTVDGPRGPRHKAKPGAVMLARMTGKAMLPIMLQPASYWALRSWDRMIIPKPFSRVIAMKGEPIFVPADADAEVLESKRMELQNAIDSLIERCQRHIDQDSSSDRSRAGEADAKPAAKRT